MHNQAQQEVYTILTNCAQEHHFFLKRNNDERALFISDYPRRAKAIAKAENLLRSHGYVLTQQNADLWHIDMTVTKYARCMPVEQELRFPICEKWHEAYALCRFLLLHAQEDREETLPLVRSMMKTMMVGEKEVLQHVSQWHERAVYLQRTKQPLSRFAFLLLTHYIQERNSL